MRASNGAYTVKITGSVYEQASRAAATAVRAAGEGVKHVQVPAAAAVGRDLINHAHGFRPAGGSRSVDVSMFVDRNGTAGSGTIAAAREGVDHTLGPNAAIIRELEHYSAAAFARTPATGDSGAVEIALRVERHALVGFPAVGAAREVVEDGVHSGRSDLEDRTAAECSSLHGGAVKVSRAIHYQFGVGVLAVRAAAKTVDQLGGVGSPSCRGQKQDRRANCERMQTSSACHTALRIESILAED